MNSDDDESNSGYSPTIEGGYVHPLQDLPSFDEAAHRAETARKMAFLLVWILAVSVLIHFVATGVFSALANETAVKSLNTIFTTWLPVISGLASSAGTYYFAKDN